MAVAEKYRAKRPFKFNGRRIEQGDSVDRDYILKVSPEKLRVLQVTGFIELDPVTRPLDKMTKADLVDYGREVGAEVNPNMVKADLVAAIESEF